VTLTNVSPGRWYDFMACSHDEQLLIVETFRGLDWTKKPDTMKSVLEVLGTIGMIAGVVSGVAGAAGAIAALKTL
jgi:hypothetical protein